MSSALLVSVLVQIQVWRAVQSNGTDDEHDDFKIRTETRRLNSMQKAIEEQKAIIAKLHESHDILQQEKDASKAMYHHEEQETKSDTTKYENPLQEGQDKTDE
eukprot:COSAG02_NODE_107_length_36312_cov_45.037942_26_plen_103_part_00